MFDFTRGGNPIDVGSSNLHADWDNVLKTLDPEAISPKVIARAKVLPLPTPMCMRKQKVMGDKLYPV